MSKTIGLVFSVLLLSGCVGVVGLSNPSQRYGGEEVRPGGRGYCCSGPERVATQEAVLARWGEPDERWQQGAHERWRYAQGGLRWAGVMPVLIVPIPLLLPTGRNGTTFEFKGERLLSAEASDGQASMALCGFFLNSAEAGMDFGCIAD